MKTARHEAGNRYYIPADADQYDTHAVDLLAGYAQEQDTAFFIPAGEASGTRQRVTFTELSEMGSEANRERANHISDYRFDEALARV